MTESDYWDRIAALADRARRDRESFDPPAEPPDRERAKALLDRGVRSTVSLFLDAHTNDEHLSSVEHALLQRALNDWLTLYARCYDEELDAVFTVRELAAIVAETNHLPTAVQRLTRIPSDGRDREVAPVAESGVSEPVREADDPRTTGNPSASEK